MKSTINFGYLIFLSVVAALGGFLFGYDTAVISGTIALWTRHIHIRQKLHIEADLSSSVTDRTL